MTDVRGKVLKLKADLTLVSVEESGALLDIENKFYYELNDTAYFLLKGLEEGRQYETILAELVSEFNVSEETARRDIGNVIDELCMQGLLVVHEEKGDSLTSCGSIKGTRPYQTPVLEYQKELIVATAATLR